MESDRFSGVMGCECDRFSSVGLSVRSLFWCLVVDAIAFLVCRLWRAIAFLIFCYSIYIYRTCYR
ncbi:MAG: hypothetical protein ACKO11_15630, partial [Cuspidothrix sp.]